MMLDNHNLPVRQILTPRALIPIPTDVVHPSYLGNSSVLFPYCNYVRNVADAMPAMASKSQTQRYVLPRAEAPFSVTSQSSSAHPAHPVLRKRPNGGRFDASRD
jgi:hypothetical protein